MLQPCSEVVLAPVCCRSRGEHIVEWRVIYLRMDQSLGAAHWVAQWARWKTVNQVSIGGV
jgi:hypothetical protein